MMAGDRLLDVLVEFRESPVGQQLLDPDETVGQCKPASLALLGLLHERAMPDASLLYLERDGECHYVVQLGDVVVDPSARQFPEHANEDAPATLTYDEIATKWRSATLVDLSNDWDARFVHDVPRKPPEWRSARQGLPIC